MVPNCGIHPTYSDRQGRECIVPATRGKSRIQTLRDQSFQVNGPRLFNCLPKNLRDMKRVTVDEFKEKLDSFLALMPDHPKIGDMIPSTCNQITAKPSNSLLDVTKQKLQINGGG